MSLLTSIANFLLNVPPYAVIEPNEGGVFLRGGKWKKTLDCGWYWKYPVYDVVRKLDITTQVINLPNQSMVVKDGRCVAASGAIEYDIPDARKALLCIQDFDISLQNLAMGTIAHYLNRKNYADCMDIAGLEREVLSALRKKVEDWGLYITKFWITDFAEHKVYRIMTHDTPVSLLLPEEE